MSSFSGTGRSTNSIAWKRWLLWNKWILQWSKKKKNLLKWAKLQSIGEANWLGVVNFLCMQISLVMSMRFILGDVWNDAPCSSRVCCLAIIKFLSNRGPWFSCIYKHALNQFRKKSWNTMWKVNILKNTWPSTKLGREKLLAVKSCFVYNRSPPHFFWSPSKLDSTLLRSFLFFVFEILTTLFHCRKEKQKDSSKITQRWRQL